MTESGGFCLESRLQAVFLARDFEAA